MIYCKVDPITIIMLICLLTITLLTVHDHTGERDVENTQANQREAHTGEVQGVGGSIHGTTAEIYGAVRETQ